MQTVDALIAHRFLCLRYNAMSNHHHVSQDRPIGKRAVSQVYSSHQRIDDRNLAMGKLIAEKLRADPSLVGVGVANIHRWNKLHGETPPAYLEWLEILHGPLDTILDVLTSSSENATRLRSSHPFPGVVSQTERQAIHESYSARTYHQSR